MQALKDYVDQKNRWGKLFGSKPLDLNSAPDRRAIAQSIDADLSPENLHCDGEISPAQARAKYRQLTLCAEQLRRLDPTVEFYEY